VRIKLDENLGRPHIALLKRHGYEADRVFDQGLSGIEDADLWLRVRRDGQFLITLELGFSDVRRYAPGTHPGILLLRPRRKGRNAVSKVLRRVLMEQRLETLAGCLRVGPEYVARKPNGGLDKFMIMINLKVASRSA
jgi:predicted nuclease of predicted toxin-antitoxin system